MPYLRLGLLACGAYLLGSLPFALWVTRWKAGVDVREVGSRHAGATNTMRQAGWSAGVLVLGLDLAKGWLAVTIGQGVDLPAPQAMAILAASVVAGHCWPIFARFRGGMGLAAAGGALLALSPLGLAIGLGVLAGSVLVVRHTARGVILGIVLTLPALWLLDARGVELWAVGLMGLVLMARFSADWSRQYTELWLDRRPD